MQTALKDMLGGPLAAQVAWHLSVVSLVIRRRGNHNLDIIHHLSTNACYMLGSIFKEDY